MTRAKKIVAKPKDQKSEFLKELVDRYAYWKDKKCDEFALAYERMIYAFTSPEPPKKDK